MGVIRLLRSLGLHLSSSLDPVSGQTLAGKCKQKYIQTRRFRFRSRALPVCQGARRLSDLFAVEIGCHGEVVVLANLTIEFVHPADGPLPGHVQVVLLSHPGISSSSKTNRIKLVT